MSSLLCCGLTKQATEPSLMKVLFPLAYGVEVVIPVEVKILTFRIDNFDEENNDASLLVPQIYLKKSET